MQSLIANAPIIRQFYRSLTIIPNHGPLCNELMMTGSQPEP